MIELSYRTKQSSQYVQSLLFTSDKKTCSNLAESVDVSHDVIYKNFINTAQSPEATVDRLIRLAKDNLSGATYLILDDTNTSKKYAKKIEGLSLNFDGSEHRPIQGIAYVTAMLTDNRLRIPVNAIQYISKDIAQGHYRTKCDIGMGIIVGVKDKIAFERFLGDALYSTKPMLTFLSKEQINFLMKFTRSRVVTINEIKGRLDSLLRLRKNERMRSIRGVFDGRIHYFHVAKLSNKSTVYFISNDPIKKSELLKLYKIRWNIEIFHRTSKQYL